MKGPVTADNELAAYVRQKDPDRFLCALFAPAGARPLLLLLAAFNHELARARAVVREPAMAHIRLQWWREVIEGAQRRHPVAAPLAAALRNGALDPVALLRMVDGREIEAEDVIDSVADWRDYLLATQGEVTAEAGRVLGVAAGESDRLRELGAAYGAGWMLRSYRALATQERCLLPADALAAQGLSPHAVLTHPEAPALAGVMAGLAGIASDWLRAGRVRLPREQMAAALPGALAARDLRQAGQPVGPRGLGDRLAVVLGYLRRKAGSG